MITRRALLLVVFVIGVITAACGGGAASSLDVAMSDFKFAPSEWEVAANTELDLELSNTGAVEHEWVIMQQGSEISSEAELPESEEELLADFVLWEEEVEPGETKNLTVPALDIGEYQIICAIEGHFSAGMEGTLTVVDG